MRLELLDGLLSQPLWLQIWVAWLIVVNSACVFFLSRKPARWVLTAWLVNIALMTTLAQLNGFNRLLGLSHVVAWTPLLAYLYKQARDGAFTGSTGYERWVRTLFVTDLSGGDSHTLDSWELEITGVPEPGTVSLLLLGAALLARRRR